MIELIPAIDIIDGKCVRLSQGDYASKKVYNEDPLEVAKMFEDNGLRRLHVVDLDGAKAHHIVNYKILDRIASHTELIIDFGGGLKSDEDIKIAFDCGARMVTGGSIAVKNPDVFNGWITRYGADRIILGADVKDKKLLSVDGWNRPIAIFSHLWRHIMKRYRESHYNRYFPRRHVARTFGGALSGNVTALARYFPYCQWWRQLYR